MEKPAIPEVIEDFRRYVRRPYDEALQIDYESGGSLHVVLDDFNVEDSHVQFCAEFAEKVGDDEGRRLAGILLTMSRTQRLTIAKLCWQ